jgi:hypothetical protein
LSFTARAAATAANRYYVRDAAKSRDIVCCDVTGTASATAARTFATATATAADSVEFKRRSDANFRCAPKVIEINLTAGRYVWRVISSSDECTAFVILVDADGISPTKLSLNLT